MTHGISTEDISGLAMIWTDEEDGTHQISSLHGMTDTYDNTYKTIWSCGTEQVHSYKHVSSNQFEVRFMK